MARDIPVGNGSFLVTFDRDYQIRDVYFPHVGQENHAGGGPSHFGIHTSLPDGTGAMLAWTADEGWTKRLLYLSDTLTTRVTLEHRKLKVALYCNDVVDFHRPVLVRRVKIKNLADVPRRITVFHHQDFSMFGTKIGDTVYYDPQLRSVIHYRRTRYLMATFFADDEQRIDEYATGTSGFQGAEGTWRDAEDGRLQGNPVAQGAVDSTIALHMDVEAHGESVIYFLIGAGHSRDDLAEIQSFIFREGPQGAIDRTTAYWRLWISGININFGNLPAKVVELFKRSLLVVRTQIDNNGAVIAAADSDIMQFSRDTYAYMWPRDGALVANALDVAGFPEIARWFYQLCSRIISDEGYFLHKYNPDGSPASSWHPWVANGHEQLPIQEDETAIVLWALWRHYFRFRDIEFVRPMWIRLIRKAADFMVNYRDPATGLPKPSYDLWEERYGIHAFTVAAVHAGLGAARNFAVCFGDHTRAQLYQQACTEIYEAAGKHLYSERLGRFLRRIESRSDGSFAPDETVDSSLFGLVKFRLFELDDPRVVATVQAIEQKLWVKTRVGGLARYEQDNYHRVAAGDHAVPGNPWFLCTIWLADYFIDRAQNPQQLRDALPILEWVAGHALDSGILAEQVHPYTNEPISVSPLTWSHAALVTSVANYLRKLEELQVCSSCGQPLFRMRHAGPPRLAEQTTIDEEELRGERAASADVAPRATFTKDGYEVTVAIDVRDCIGCEVCLTHCRAGVLEMVNDKAMLRLDNVQGCTLCFECERVCPVGAISARKKSPGADAEDEPEQPAASTAPADPPGDGQS